MHAARAARPITETRPVASSGQAKRKEARMSPGEKQVTLPQLEMARVIRQDKK